MAKRAKPRTRFYRCHACRAFVPTGYNRCGHCGHDHGSAESMLIGKLLSTFPGTREV